MVISKGVSFYRPQKADRGTKRVWKEVSVTSGEYYNHCVTGKDMCVKGPRNRQTDIEIGARKSSVSWTLEKGDSCVQR